MGVITLMFTNDLDVGVRGQDVHRLQVFRLYDLQDELAPLANAILIELLFFCFRFFQSLQSVVFLPLMVLNPALLPPQEPLQPVCRLYIDCQVVVDVEVAILVAVQQVENLNGVLLFKFSV